uniref:hypothetical protein n=2 Tax=Roseivirga sp. TaxID=1964215 RepID=UPI004048842E
MSSPMFDILNLEDLELDSYNPRLPKSLQGASESQIIEFMLLEASTLELMQAIGENDFFAGEQLLVVKNGKKYTVVEGNRRLTAVKLLNNKSLATVQKSKVNTVLEEATFIPKKIPALIFDKKEEILRYLGYRHITGVKSWRLLEKARYLYELKKESFGALNFGNACRELAKVIGSRRDYVERMIIGFEIYSVIEDSSFYKIPGLNDTNFYFNYISDSLNRSNIREFLNVDMGIEEPTKNLQHDKVKELSHWFFEKNREGKVRVLGDSSSLNKLNKVLGDNEAKELFESKEYSLNDAFEITNGMDEVFEREIRKSLLALSKADQVAIKVKSFYSDLMNDLTVIRKLTKKIKDLKDSTEEDEF